MTKEQGTLVDVEPIARQLHVLVLEVPDAEFPEGYEWRLECPGAPHCLGWSECDEEHVHEGRIVGDPYDTSEGDPWEGAEEFELHGVVHTWHDGSGWCLPFTGCVTSANNPDVPEDLIHPAVKPGRWQVDTCWHDEYAVELIVVGPAEEPDEGTRRA